MTKQHFNADKTFINTLPYTNLLFSEYKTFDGEGAGWAGATAKTIQQRVRAVQILHGDGTGEDECLPVRLIIRGFRCFFKLVYLVY